MVAPRIVLVGPDSSGRHHLALLLTRGVIPGYIPLIIQRESFAITYRGVQHVFVLDLVMETTELNVCQSYYSEARAALLCISIDDSDAETNMKTWIQLLKRFLPFVPIVIVGTKNDLRENPDVSVLDVDTFADLAQRLGASRYTECSAIRQSGISELKNLICQQAFDNNTSVEA
ncbi:unnamed protein product [Lymnaea stagnalis]|uniref:Uncharacterized protein n=1 Tax=Lymnaea stagnalis TaxID=6523 RepID=A0AAV2HB71_LYMST